MKHTVAILMLMVLIVHDAGDIMLTNYNAKGFPYEPNLGYKWYKDISTFKTRKFVIKELEKITNAIIKYNITKN